MKKLLIFAFLFTLPSMILSKDVTISNHGPRDVRIYLQKRGEEGAAITDVINPGKTKTEEVGEKWSITFLTDQTKKIDVFAR